MVIELKIGDFKPADAGQVELYLRWLDRMNDWKATERLSAVILCADKRRETVELLELELRGIARRRIPDRTSAPRAVAAASA